MPRVKLDTREIQRAAVGAFVETCYLAHRKMIAVISEPGAFPGFSGDIVDTGALRAAQLPPEFSKGGTVCRFRNVVFYAVYVYLGFTLSNGVEVEGRPWMEEALRRMDFQRVFSMMLKAKL